MGNKKQFLFNQEIPERLQEISCSIERGYATHTVLSSISDVSRLLQHRNKLIRLEDKSDSGWQVVEEYEQDELASDSGDEKKICQAEFHAARKRRMRRRLPLENESTGLRRIFSARGYRFNASTTTTYNRPSSSSISWSKSRTF